VPLDDYVSGRFPAHVVARLLYWRKSFAQDPMRKLVGRNVDRECDRNDIEQSVWVEFLREAAEHVLPEKQIQLRAHMLWCARGKPRGSGLEDWYRAERELLDELILDPLITLHAIASARSDVYTLRGGELPFTTCPRLHRYVPISIFWEYNLQRMPISAQVGPVGPHEVGFQILASRIQSGIIDSSWIVGTSLGATNRPVWCTDRSLLPGRTADNVRDALGLKHVGGGFLVEISYSVDALRDRSHNLRAPTVLDAAASDEENWIFLKNRVPGAGPDWGYTGSVSAGGILEQGPPEAVHSPFQITSKDASHMTLDATDSITSSFPGVNYLLTLENDV
jgi:hypothetical protein